MSITLEQLSAKMRQGEQVPLQQTAQIVLTLSIPSILQQIVVTAMEYIDAAMVGHIGASATASIGIVSSSTWLLHGMLAGLYMSFSIQVAQYLGAHRQGCGAQGGSGGHQPYLRHVYGDDHQTRRSAACPLHGHEEKEVPRFGKAAHPLSRTGGHPEYGLSHVELQGYQ